MSKFMSGLRLEIGGELRLFQPVELGQAMDLAQMLEDKFGPLPIKAMASVMQVGHPQS